MTRPQRRHLPLPLPLPVPSYQTQNEEMEREILALQTSPFAEERFRISSPERREDYLVKEQENVGR